jgi:glycosyltransferase involved in cell wall biosynthesis
MRRRELKTLPGHCIYMKILVLSPFFPWPLYGGNLIRIFGILKELSCRGHEIFLLAGHSGPAPSPENPVKALCRQVEFYPRPGSSQTSHPVRARLRALFSPYPYNASRFGSNEIRRVIQAILAKQHFDLILANFAFLADSVPRPVAQGIPVVLDEHESEGLLWRQYLRQGSVAMRAFALLNLLKLAWFQKRLASRIDAILCASDRETEFARTFIPAKVGLWTVPNGIDADSYRSLLTAQKDSHAIIFCGGLSVFRNRLAALWFAHKVFPAIRREIPDAEFWIVGSDPNQEIRDLETTPGIHVTGTVEDVRPYYARAAVSVVPYRYGEGTKLKVLEAMASGVPVVTTTIGCQGIDVVDGEHVLIADSELDFGDRVISLLRDGEKRAHLAGAARRRIEEKYRWQKIVGDVEPKLLALAKKSAD